MSLPRRLKHLARGLTAAGGAALTVLVGLACLDYAFADPLRRLSYDLPFVWRSTIDTHEIVLVYLDDESAKELNQPLGDSWNRSLHVQLLDRLSQDKARLVLYDVVFDAPWPDPAADLAFADALKRHGGVVLGAALEVVEQMGGVHQERVLAPTKILRKASAGWGLLAFRPIDADYGIRQLYTGTGDVPTATWRGAEVYGAAVTRGAREAERWINYYGPRDSVASVNFAQALMPNGVPPGFFAGKIVFVGGRSAVGYLGRGLDEFGTPYSRFSRQFTSGLEVHANILLNLIRGEWLTRLQPRWERLLVVAVGLLAGGLLSLLRPWIAVIAALLASVALSIYSCDLVWHHRLWFNWLVPAGIQVPLGLVWSIGSQYLLESRRRKELRRAFGFYLSPAMADRIANSDFDLAPGGKLTEVTVIFTDLEHFTTLSENLDPSELSKILTDYFGQTTRCILEKKGTIIKYIGDAVFAAWGAPLEEPAHAIRAAEAACALRGLTELTVRGKKLRTRVGIHSGQVLAGNLGSAYRFDYTMLGDPVNFASRLESLNKYLSTQVLISDAVKQQLDDRFITRLMGEFRVAGKTRSVTIHELYCERNGETKDMEWIKIFEEGLRIFREGNFSGARVAMEETEKLRGGFDGPAQFYLRKIEGMGTSPPADWNGVVELSDK